MGAFHEGHLQLMQTARANCDHVVVSLFVNPTQFGKGEDFDRYPRDLERDSRMAAAVGVDVMFCPDVTEIYPRETSVVRVPEVTQRYEGEQRPGHFDGVSTIVCKLFNIVRPHVAYFGLKDLQQCAVIERMVRDLNMNLSISLQATVREADGLALSSRNVYLTREERAVAPQLHQQLKLAASRIRQGSTTETVLSEAVAVLSTVGFEVAYFDLIDRSTFAPVCCAAEGTAIIAAAKLGTTRLIDNILL
jgi:pantoate--beta-alanine ligase